jgi:PII-like signaling protein
LPLLIEFIDSREAVEALLPEIRTLLGDGLILTQPVEVYVTGNLK